MTTEWTHTTVMLHEAIEGLAVKPDGTYVDATFGRGGHTRLLLSRLGAQGRVIAFDRDPEAVQAAAALQDPRLDMRHDAFVALSDLPAHSVDGVLMDLGVSSPQIDDPQRGFSFRNDGPLDMRMDPTRGQALSDWLATASVAHMAEVIREYGEERFALPIAKAIAARRQERGALVRTLELAQLVADTVKTREPGQNPATRTFQAFRIHINGELAQLEQALEGSLHILKPGGRLAVISFHSLEDRRVKQFIQRHAKAMVDRRVPFAPERPMPLRAVGRFKASEAEIAANPRSRSAILRVAERTHALKGHA